LPSFIGSSSRKKQGPTLRHRDEKIAEVSVGLAQLTPATAVFSPVSGNCGRELEIQRITNDERDLRDYPDLRPEGYGIGTQPCGGLTQR
jgi:hypothetical protein